MSYSGGCFGELGRGRAVTGLAGCWTPLGSNGGNRGIYTGLKGCANLTIACRAAGESGR